jgi:hypothetical protein
MRITNVYILAILIFLCIGIESLFAQAVRIMPMGNSITYDHNSLDDSNPRPVGDRISYRYKLYQLLTASGLEFDFVGSEDTGNNYFQNSQFDDNAGFPGITSSGLATLINTGYNNYSHQYVSSGPYLTYHPADIILLHIGTNNLTTSASDVESVLNNIRFHDNDVIVLVARIVNRKTYHPSTTTFNNNVEFMVSGRNDPRIIMVNIETGAGINYSMDMIDNLHPNQAGYDKMALKWYDEIMNLNRAPVITYIPTQQTEKGTPFPDLNLDTYVSDQEDPDFLLSWSYEQEPDSRLTISIDASRVLHVTPDPDWSGVETVNLKVKDTGNGAFVQKAEMEVTYMVDHVNTPPVISSIPEEYIVQGDEYEYNLVATDADEDPLSFKGIDVPSWLSFDESSWVLSGIPQNEDVGQHHVILQVSDGFDPVNQVFEIEVEDANDPPLVTSNSNPEVYQDKYFSFTITAVDVDGDPVSYSLIDKPAWLNYNTSLHILTGRPGNNEVGDWNMTVVVSDGAIEVNEPLTVSALNVNDEPVITSVPPDRVILGEAVLYHFTAEDIDPSDDLVYTALTLPGWLDFLDTGNDALVYGTPSEDDLGGNLVILQVTDGIAKKIQSFNLVVSYPTGIEDSDGEFIQRVYPNPAKDRIKFEFSHVDNTTIHIYNSTGILQAVFTAEHTRFLEADVSGLPSGIYLYRVYQDGIEGVGRFVKN